MNNKEIDLDDYIPQSGNHFTVYIYGYKYIMEEEKDQEGNVFLKFSNIENGPELHNLSYVYNISDNFEKNDPSSLEWAKQQVFDEIVKEFS